MKQKNWKAITSVLLLAALVTAGFIAIAAEYGTSDDPLVSLSYINNVLAPEISSKVDEIIAEKTESLSSELDGKISSFKSELDGKISEYTSRGTDAIVNDAFVASVADRVAAKVSGQGTESSVFKLVKLTSGQTLTAKIGCEILLRIGTATCVASGSPGLIDMSTAGEISGGNSLEKNHLYLCTIDGRGVKATSNITIMVRGPYTIS